MSKNDDNIGYTNEMGEDVLVVVPRVVDPYIVCFHEPNGYRAEQFRGLRNRLLTLNPDGAARTLVVTSAIAGEGKSSVSINLAIALGELEEHRILVVDFDLRRPSLERMLGLGPEQGVSDLLLGNCSLDAIVRSSGMPNVDLIGAGRRPTNPGELLASRRLDDLFAQLKQDYNYVVIDTPPVLPITDAGLISAKCDGTLFVVGLEQAPRKMVREALENIEELGARVLGSFVTGVRGADPSSDSRYRYSEND